MIAVCVCVYLAIGLYQAIAVCVDLADGVSSARVEGDTFFVVRRGVEIKEKLRNQAEAEEVLKAFKKYTPFFGFGMALVCFFVWPLTLIKSRPSGG